MSLRQSVENWENDVAIYTHQMNQYLMTEKAPDRDFIRKMDRIKRELELQSPFDHNETISKLAEFTSTSLELYGLLRRSHLDPQAKRWIHPSWIIERYMPPENWVTLLYKKPGDIKTRLFRESDDKQWTTVEYKSQEHRNLWKRNLMFRRTSISPFDEDDEEDERELPTIRGPDSPFWKQIMEMLESELKVVKSLQEEKLLQEETV